MKGKTGTEKRAAENPFLPEKTACREPRVENCFWQYLKFFAKINKLKKAFRRKPTFDLRKFGGGGI